MGRFPAPIVCATQHCIACEQQTHFWSSFLSLRKKAIFQRERSDHRKCVCCNQSKPCRNNVAMLQYCAKNCRCYLSLVSSPSACMLGFPNSDHVIYSPGILPCVCFTRTCAWDGIWKKPFSRFLWWGWGGGYITKRCIMGNVKMVNLKISGSWREETASEFR